MINLFLKASKKSSPPKQAPVAEEAARNQKSEKRDQPEPCNETVNQERDLDAKPVKRVDKKTLLENKTDSEETNTVADQVSSRRSSRSSVNLFSDSGNLGNKDSIVSAHNKDSIEMEPLASTEHSQDNQSLSTDSSSLGKESKSRVTEVRVGSASKKGSVKPKKDTTVPSHRSNSVTSSTSGRTSVVSRNESSEALNRTSSSQSPVGNQRKQEPIHKEKVTEADSKKETLIVSESSDEKETSVKTEMKIDNDISPDEEESYQNFKSSTGQEDNTLEPQTEKPQIGSGHGNETVVDSDENDQDLNSKVAETTGTSTEYPKKDSEHEVVLGYKETWDPLIGRVSPIPSIGSDELEPVDPELLEY